VGKGHFLNYNFQKLLKMKKIHIIIISCLLVFGSACDKYLDINEDPSFPQVAQGFALFPPLLANMVRGETFDSRFINQYVQYWVSASAGNTHDRHGYVAGSDGMGEKWRQHYWALGTNIDLVIKDGVENNKWDYTGAAKAIRAWSWQSSTDYHGEMILKQAFEPNRYVFDYDSQEEIYAEVRRLCEDAIKDLSRTDYGKSLNRGDLVYGGDTDKWTRFVYAILARNAHHISNKSSYNPDKVIEFVDKSFRSNADNFNVPHNGSNTSDANFYGPLRSNLNAYIRSSYIVGLLDSTILGARDPRLPIMFTASPDGAFRGAVAGSGDPNAQAGNVRRIPNMFGELGTGTGTGKWIFANNTPHHLITYMELQFMKAEAAFIKGDRTLAYATFQNAVNAALDFCAVPAAAKTTFLASRAIPQSAAALTLSHIMVQKFIALYGHGGLETWVDMRRYNYSPDVYTGFVLPTSLFPDNNGLPAQRVRPRFNSEYVWNRDALAKIGADLPDYHTKPLWFTQK
jgi:hypothetical protein